ncbi:hypothetical protein NQ318_003312 [Aromia moschata]|uniref:Transporter n=1 Tax=Aromia moschata TaxID=1265417 RepID=A0AAV8YMD0_9CUCU|nr:hypothetical protein NQ318_003312 [Aromia moschata]
MNEVHETIKKKSGFEEREKWKNKTEYLLSCIGYCIGIGNVWRFPYLCYRSGGGAFLVPYLIMLIFCGIPLFFMETSMGQFASTGCITLFKISPLFKGAGYAMVIVNFIVSTYFNVICSYPLIFLVYSLQSKLPWVDCSNEWNTDHCVEIGSSSMELLLNQTTDSHKQMKTPADEFFQCLNVQALELWGHKISNGIGNVGGVVWQVFLASAVSWTCTYLCIKKGVQSVGKVVYFTATFPAFILLVLLIRGLTLPGAWDGVRFYLYPQWDQLTNLKMWADAAIQIFYSLGPGWGGIVNMASFNDFKNNNKLDSIIVPLLNSATSIVAGFVVFSVLGYLSHETGLPVSTVATSGPGLAFVTYPEAISLMPWPQLWAILFFLMLFFLGLDSLFVTIESIVNSIVDEYPQFRRQKSWITFLSVVMMMAVSTLYTTKGGMYWVQLFDWYSASISVVLICLVEVLIVGWTYGVKNFKEDIEFMIKEKISWFWTISWKVTTPSILAFIFYATIKYNTRISYQGIVYPDWAINIGWASCYTSMLCIPVYMGYRLLYEERGDLIDRLKTAIRPREDWCPARREDKALWAKSVLGKIIADIDQEVDPCHEQFVQLCVMEK